MAQKRPLENNETEQHTKRRSMNLRSGTSINKIVKPGPSKKKQRHIQFQEEDIQEPIPSQNRGYQRIPRVIPAEETPEPRHQDTSAEMYQTPPPAPERNPYNKNNRLNNIAMDVDQEMVEQTQINDSRNTSSKLNKGKGLARNQQKPNPPKESRKRKPKKVLSGSPVHLVIGNNWLNLAKAKIDFGNATLTINYKNQQVCVPLAYTWDMKHQRLQTRTLPELTDETKESESDEYSTSSEDISTESEGELTDEDVTEFYLNDDRKSYKMQFREWRADDGSICYEVHNAEDIKIPARTKINVIGELPQQFEMDMMFYPQIPTSISLETRNIRNDVLEIWSTETIIIPTNSTIQVHGQFSRIIQRRLRFEPERGISPEESRHEYYCQDIEPGATLFTISIHNYLPSQLTIPPPSFIGTFHEIQDKTKSSSQSEQIDARTKSLTDEQLNLLNIPEIPGDRDGNLQKEFIKLITQYQDCFAWTDDDLGCNDILEHKITLKPDAVPVASKPYRLAPVEAAALKQELD
ncbi:hypothetical protein BDA99DRAFT_563296 [Phascolomyces articulosus]|uniref:Uncharacterized protein n=1 Tax=Phascolomyces articulosus TaxID=60185 RepID=A0AAD5K3W0_9FUNG|nr:hypothetical protein BDA99DRAFT_563296 [Phascolomyces articulosus]